MTIWDGKNPRFYMTIPTTDGRWMVAYALQGVITIISEFPPGSSDDAETVAASRNKAEMARYVEESSNQMIEKLKG
jgi:hypothetical protein